MSRYLIINADDFGLTEAVSRGIIKAHREGILTSTTYMVNFPWSEEQAGMLAEAPHLGVGVHLNLTTGSPVLPPEQVPTLVTGHGRFSKAVLHLLSRVSVKEAQREWSAQVTKAIRILGRTPSHLDTHRYLQGYPPFAEAMIAVAREHRIPAVRCLYPGPDLAMGDLFRSWSPTRWVVDRYLRRSAELVRESGLARPDATQAGDFDLPGLLRRLDRVREGVTELVSHPGEVDDQLRSLSSMQEHRETELAALTSPEARARAEALGIRLISFAHFAG